MTRHRRQDPIGRDVGNSCLESRHLTCLRDGSSPVCRLLQRRGAVQVIGRLRDMGRRLPWHSHGEAEFGDAAGSKPSARRASGCIRGDSSGQPVHMTSGSGHCHAPAALCRDASQAGGAHTVSCVERCSIDVHWL
jgi:hypothetical protein